MPDGQNPPMHTHASVSQPPGPLAGVRVLDFTRVLAGPYCSMLLGDAGADVIKVERPGVGDDTRQWGPPFLGDESVYFLTINRNKRSIAVDLGSEAGRDVIRRLAGSVDVVLENFRPGTMERLGLAYEQLAADNPGLIFTSISGYGSTGPRVDEPGYDAFVMALGGLMSITGERDGDPVRPGVAMLDMSVGIHAYGSIAAALFARTTTGRGQHIELSLLATQMGLLVNMASNQLNAGLVADRMGAEHPSIVPYNTYPATDGHVMLGALNDDFWRRLCAVAGLDDLAERFPTNRERVAHRDDVNRAIADWTRRYRVDELVAMLRDADVTVAPINDIAAALADPQVAALGLVQSFDHPDAGTFRVVGPTVDFSGTPGTIRRPPPRLGEHTDEVLAEIGMDTDAVAGLRADGVVA